MYVMVIQTALPLINKLNILHKHMRGLLVNRRGDQVGQMPLEKRTYCERQAS